MLSYSKSLNSYCINNVSLNISSNVRCLNLSNMNIKTISNKAAFHMKNCHSLILNNNELRTFFDIDSDSRIVFLSLTNNKIKKMGKITSRSLSFMNLSNNPISEFPDMDPSSIFDLNILNTKIEIILNLNFAKLSNFARFEKLTRLENCNFPLLNRVDIDCKDTYIRNLKFDILDSAIIRNTKFIKQFDMPELKDLYLYGCMFDLKLLDNYKKLEKLFFQTPSYNVFEHDTSKLKKLCLKDVVDLELSDCNFQSLETLVINNSSIKSMSNINVPSIKNVILINSNIHDIDNKAFISNFYFDLTLNNSNVKKEIFVNLINTVNFSNYKNLSFFSINLLVNNCKILNFERCNFVESEFTVFESLLYIRMKSCEFLNFSNVNFKSLRRIELIDNDICEMSNVKFETLLEAEFKNQTISHIYSLTSESLIRLAIINCKLKYFTCKIPNVKVLLLQNNLLEKFDIANQLINSLNLSNNPLSSLTVRNVNYLTLDNCKINFFTEFVTECILYLSLKNNKLASLNCLRSMNLSLIKEIDFTNNNLKSIFMRLSDLNKLILKDNPISLEKVNVNENVNIII